MTNEEEVIKIHFLFSKSSSICSLAESPFASFWASAIAFATIWWLSFSAAFLTLLSLASLLAWRITSDFLSPKFAPLSIRKLRSASLLFTCRPKSCPLLGVLRLPNNLIPRNSYEKLFECFFRDTVRHCETTALITIPVTEYRRRDLTVVWWGLYLQGGRVCEARCRGRLRQLQRDCLVWYVKNMK